MDDIDAGRKVMQRRNVGIVTKTEENAVNVVILLEFASKSSGRLQTCEKPEWNCRRMLTVKSMMCIQVKERGDQA